MGQTCLLGHIREDAISVVVVKRVAVNPGDKNVVVNIIVVVSNGDARVEAGDFESGLFGDIGEGAVAIVVEEAIPILCGILLKSVDVCAVGKEDVRMSIAIVVEHGYAASHGFRCVALRRFVAVEREQDGTR